jgi:sec-independent protein translocase protein TatC
MAVRIGRRGKGGAEEPEEPDPNEGRMTLGEHLTELRNRIIKALIAIAIGGVVGFFLYGTILDILLDPYCQILPEGRDCTLIVTNPVEELSVRMKLSAYVGLLLASPVVMWQLWRFVTPGLYDNEKRYAIPFVGTAVLLFLLGAGLALWAFPQALSFLTNIGGEDLEAFYTPGNYFNLIVFMMLAFGVGFQFPILLTFLQLAGVLHWRTLAGWRRYAIVVIFVATAIITPSGDPFTLLALGIPLVLFYEISILIGRFVFKKP